MSTFFRTVNQTDKRVWVTIYTQYETNKICYGWVNAQSYTDWPSDGFSYGMTYKIRGEVKSDSSGNNPTIYDTEILASAPWDSSHFTTVTLIQGTTNYYWENDQAAGEDPEKASS